MIGRRLPIESGEPVIWIARVRLLFVVTVLAAVLVVDAPDQSAPIIVIAAAALPWSAAALWATRRRPGFSLSPLVAVMDFAVLGAIQLADPDAYGALRFVALFFIAAHAYFLGPARGVLVAIVAVAALVPAAATLHHIPVHGGTLAGYEVLFGASALACGFLVALLRTAESAARLRARDVSRRAIEAEAEMRRRVAESIHDGPVQELVSLDLTLAAVEQAAKRGDGERTQERLAEARAIAERNIGALRDEIISLGPYAFDEIGYDVAVEQSVPLWERRYAIEIELAIDQLDLANEVCGPLFLITQEAVANAGRHAEGTRVVITLRAVGDEVELRVSDDGHGFGDETPLATTKPGHIGLASMKERAELIGGHLEIETGERGTKILVRSPRQPAAATSDGV